MLPVLIQIQAHRVSPRYSQLYGEGWLMEDSTGQIFSVTVLSSLPGVRMPTEGSADLPYFPSPSVAHDCQKNDLLWYKDYCL